MVSNGSVIIDARLYQATPEVEQALIHLRPKVVEIRSVSDVNAPASRPGALVAGFHRLAGYGPGDLARRLRSTAPALGIFVIGNHGEMSPHERQRLAILGVDRIFYLEEIGSKKVARWIERRILAQAPERALAAVSKKPLPPDVSPVVQWVLRNACYRPSIEYAAEVFLLSSRTIARRLAENGLPRYGTLKRLGLLLHALELEVCLGVMRSEVARRLGFGDPAPVSRLLRSQREGRDWWAGLRLLYD